MKLEIYQTNRSVRPFTSWKSKADMMNFLEENKKIAEVCAKIKETGDKSLKSQLPAMMPMGNVGDLNRKKENCTPTGLVMIDIDGKVVLDAEVVKMDFEKLVPELERLHVRLIHITPSGTGLRLLVCCLADGMQATIDRCAEALGLKAYGEVDPACKDLSRLSYLVPSDYIIYEKDLFEDVPPISVEQMKQYQSTGTPMKHKNVAANFMEVMANDEKYKDFEYNGFRVADIVRQYIDTTGGDPAEGTRHTFYNKLIVMFRNLCNNDPKIVHAVLPPFDRGIEETWSQCVGICSSNRSTKIDSELYFWLKDRGMLASRIQTTDETQKEEEKEDIPPMPKLPPIFRQYVDIAPQDFKVPTVVALLPILGTLTSHLRAKYFDDSEQSTEFISLLFAPPSSGKSFIKRLSVLLQNLRDRDELANAREEIYANSERKKGANDKGQDAPKVSVRIVKPLISIPELLTKMRYNQGHHMYIEAEELDTFNKGNKTAGGDKSDLWRVTWDNGYYGQYYKSVNTFKGEVQMFLNLLFTSTQDQIDRFFKNVEDGLVTRFSVCPIENQQYAKFVPWGTINKQDRLRIENILNRLEMKNYKLPLRFDKQELIDIKEEDFDKVVPWQYEFQPLEHVDMSYTFQPLLKWLEEERAKAAVELNEARDVFRRRAAVKGFRLALLCHGLYSKVTPREQKTIVDFMLWFCSVDLRNSLYQFGQRYNELQENVSKMGQAPHSDIFNKLGDTFTKTELRVQLQRAFKRTPPRHVISLWHRNKLIEKCGEGKYKKLNFRKL